MVSRPLLGCHRTAFRPKFAEFDLGDPCLSGRFVVGIFVGFHSRHLFVLYSAYGSLSENFAWNNETNTEWPELRTGSYLLFTYLVYTWYTYSVYVRYFCIWSNQFLSSRSDQKLKSRADLTLTFEGV